MFQQHLREVLSQVDPKKTLIYQPNLAEKVDLLTLVKKKKGSFSSDYEVMSLSLRDLVPAFADFSDFSERTVIKDYKYSGQRSVSAGVQGGVEVASAKVSAEAQSDQEVSSVTIKEKTADIRKMKEKYRDQKINPSQMLELKRGEALGFVNKIVFNTEDVALCGRTGADGSCEARWSVFNVFLGGKMKDNNSFVVPAGHTYAYKLNELQFLKVETGTYLDMPRSLCIHEEEPFTGHALSELPDRVPSLIDKCGPDTLTGLNQLGKMNDKKSFVVPAGHTYADKLNELKFKDETIEITNRSCIEYIGGKVEELQLRPVHPEETFLLPQSFEPDDYTEETIETLQQVQEELRRIELFLQQLAHLPRVTRSALFQRLSVLSEDKHALALLRRMLEQWRDGEPVEQPQSSSVSFVLHVLRDVVSPPSKLKSGMTDMTLEAVYLLISAMDKLPDRMPSLMANCCPDTLTGLNQLVSSLKEHGQAHLSESLPAPLQEGGELHGLAVFLCSSDESLRELSELAIVTGDQPGVLLLALCAAVQGLSMLLQ